MKNLGKRIGGAILTVAFVFGISAAAGLTAQAQYRNDNGQYRRHGRDGDNDQNKDREWRRRRNDQSQNQDWRRNRNQSRRDRRYDNNGNYGRYGNNGRYGVYNNRNQIELNQGYQAGLNTGASDARRGQSYSPQRSHYYRNASTQAFREGFVRGYDVGFRQYAYGNGRYRNGSNGSGIGSILGGIFRP
jgi:hypothetical protein